MSVPMSLLAPRLQVFKKKCPLLTFPLPRRFCVNFFPPKSKDHFAREKGGTSSMEPRSSPPREADSRHSAVVPLLQKGVVFRCSAPFVGFSLVRFVRCLLCSIDIFIKKKTQLRFFFRFLPKSSSEPLRKPMRFAQKDSPRGQLLFKDFVLRIHLGGVPQIQPEKKSKLIRKKRSFVVDTFMS